MVKKERLHPLQIYQLLPHTNCKLCGLSSCFAFAFALLNRKKRPADCPELQSEAFRVAFEQLNKAFGTGEVVEGIDLVLDKEKCSGCGDCVVVCQKACSVIIYVGMIRSLREGVPSVFQVVDGHVQVINWSSCKRTLEGVALCNVCEEKCPFGAITLIKSS